MEGLVRSLGVTRVRSVDPLKLSQLEEAIKEEVATTGPSVIIARRPCVLLNKQAGTPVTVNEEACTGCKTCLRLSCPSISVNDKKCSVDPVSCVGCGLCPQVCKFGALVAAEGGGAGA